MQYPKLKSNVFRSLKNKKKVPFKNAYQNAKFLLVFKEMTLNHSEILNIFTTDLEFDAKNGTNVIVSYYSTNSNLYKKVHTKDYQRCIMNFLFFNAGNYFYTRSACSFDQENAFLSTSCVHRLIIFHSSECFYANEHFSCMKFLSNNFSENGHAMD